MNLVSGCIQCSVARVTRIRAYLKLRSLSSISENVLCEQLDFFVAGFVFFTKEHSTCEFVCIGEIQEAESSKIIAF